MTLIAIMPLYRPFFLLVLAVPAFAAEPGSGFDRTAFSPEQWPGKPPAEVQRGLAPLAQEFTQALRGRNLKAVTATRDRMISLFGRYAGVPEERPSYGQPIDPKAPNPGLVVQRWQNQLKALTGRHGWEQAKQLEASAGEGGKVPRLRVSERQIRALLETHEAGLDPSGESLKRAVSGLDYLLTTQTSGGMFGYPYDPNGPGLREMAAQQVERGQKQGLTMVERGWVIEDLGAGGLNFDNGVCGAVLLHGYVITGDRRYLESAIRAGNWAKSRPLALNFNYNGFSGLLLARLYRVTGDPAWLEAARGVFELGVLSGQMPNGRWFDQHNAKIQYHAILCAQVTEYLLALRQAKDPEAARVERQLRSALRNLAAEHLTYGTNNANESLALGALALGAMVVTAEPDLNKAAAVALNFVLGPVFAEQSGGELPETVACWLLQQSAQRAKSLPVEVRGTKLMPQ
jgi:hypothetical protein